MGTKSRETIYGASVRAAAEQASDARNNVVLLMGPSRLSRRALIWRRNVIRSRNCPAK